MPPALRPLARLGSNGTTARFRRGQRLSRQLPTLKPGCRLSARIQRQIRRRFSAFETSYARLPISAATEGDFSVTFLLKPSALSQDYGFILASLHKTGSGHSEFESRFCWHIFYDEIITALYSLLRSPRVEHCLRSHVIMELNPDLEIWTTRSILITRLFWWHRLRLYADDG